MRILVLDDNYPSDDNLYGDVFVHVRVRGYMAQGEEVQVLSFADRPDYHFDGVSVACAGTLEEYQRRITAFAPDLLVIHFFQGWMLRKILLTQRLPTAIWVHGVEALGWYRRLFNFTPSREFFRYALMNTVQMARMRKLFRYARTDGNAVSLVFVSDWMRRIAETDTLTRVARPHIIPNPIDVDRFSYSPKEPAQRTRVLLIRSFDSHKYANDLAVNAIVRLSHRPEFPSLRFTICGRGRHFGKLTAPLRDLANVTLHERFLTHHEIRSLHATHGVFLCPTRQDAQGVSMCEAMSSGLVPVTSQSTAIPEFVEDGVSGFLCRGPAEMADALALLARAPEVFTTMSRAAADSIRRKAALAAVVNSELRVLEATAARARTRRSDDRGRYGSESVGSSSASAVER